MTLRSYVELLRLEDYIRDHRFYFDAATTAVRLYLSLYDKPKEASGAGSADFAGMSEAERKKAERKARKAALKKGEENKENAAAGSGGKKGDKDVEGKKYLEGDFLEEAGKFLKPLLDFSGEKVESQILGVEVFMRKKKYLLALRSLKKAYKIDGKNPEVHRVAVKFWKSIKSEGALEGMNEAVRQVLLEELENVFGGNKTVEEFNDKFVSGLQDRDVEGLLAGAECGGGVGRLERIVRGEGLEGLRLEVSFFAIGFFLEHGD